MILFCYSLFNAENTNIISLMVERHLLSVMFIGSSR
nr:MAG TPA: hypothetical protein [Caudoviricetes sp.]